MHTHQRVRRPGRALALAAGLAFVIALPGAAATAAEPATTDTNRATETTAVVPLSAELRITHTTIGPDGEPQTTHETNHLYRDSLGRTRTEAGSSVTISDPATGTAVILDTAAGTFREVSRTQSGFSAESRSGDISPNEGLASTARPLGEAVVSGVPVEGIEHTVTVPAWESLPSQEKVVSHWRSTEIQLPVRTRVTEPTGEVYEQTYTNIQVGRPASAMFEVPAGYELAPLESSPQPTQQSDPCEILYVPVIPVLSIGPFLGSSSVPAFTDEGCTFVADAGQFYLPLHGFPTLPLGLPVDEWFVYDTGLPVPFLPYTTFGAVYFAADDDNDGPTVVASLIILDILP
jgi:hypothetical protein